jgi:hypothetical protein
MTFKKKVKNKDTKIAELKEEIADLKKKVGAQNQRHDVKIISVEFLEEKSDENMTAHDPLIDHEVTFDNIEEITEILTSNKAKVTTEAQTNNEPKIACLQCNFLFNSYE